MEFKKILFTLLGDFEENNIREDIIGLKVQAMANAPSRKTRELSDIEAIAQKFKNEINWNVVEEYFKIFDLHDEFKALLKKRKKRWWKMQSL